MILNNMDILERFKYISNVAYDFNIDNYLQKETKSLLIFLIDSINKKYSLISGVDTDNILASANKDYEDAKAGYCVNVHQVFNKKSPADLFLISDIVINSNPTHIDSIILHEIAHLLIDSSSQPSSMPSHIDDMAMKLYYATDINNADRTKHDIDFCKVLIYGCLNYQSKTKNFIDIQETVENAMRYDTFREYKLI